MKLIIDIADDQYKAVQDGMWCGSLYEELKNGIPAEQCVDCIRRQDVEDAIYDYSRSCDVNYTQIMEFIDKLPSVTPQPCDDAVSRKAVLKQINCWIGSGEYRYTNATHYLAKRMQGLSSITPQQKAGRWKRISMDKYSEHAKYWYRCDRCGKDNLGSTDYCPNCGAKMQEVNNE